MRRVDGLVDISRRELCAFACAGIALVGCIDGDTGAVQTGGLNGSDGTLPPDAAGSNNPPPPDGGMQAGACSGTNVDVGLASSFLVNKPQKFGSPNYFIVMRDANGLYAMTSKCPHQHVVVNDTGSQFHCPAHGADFTYNGAVLDGPTSKSLVHYAMCTLPNGHVGVQISMQVSASTRLVA
jgi:nitrite reductase/ring-hydroxylating ferredoxin subunit